MGGLGLVADAVRGTALLEGGVVLGQPLDHSHVMGAR